MKVNSISGVTYVNWFFVTFIAADQKGRADERSAANGSGTSLYLKVDDIEAFYKDVLSSGMKPEGEPEVQSSGNREFRAQRPRRLQAHLLPEEVGPALGYLGSPGRRHQEREATRTDALAAHAPP
jgi:hypothetical protein